MPKGIFIRSKQQCEAISKSHLGNKNPMWKGHKAGLSAIHKWVTFRKPKPKLCEFCKKVPPIDLANISQRYYRKLTDWNWLCRKCHMLSDGRLKNLIKKNKSLIGKIIAKPIKCKICKRVSRNKGLGLCSICYHRVSYYRRQRSQQTITKLNNFTLEDSIKIAQQKALPRKCPDCNNSLDKENLRRKICKTCKRKRIKIYQKLWRRKWRLNHANFPKPKIPG